MEYNVEDCFERKMAFSGYGNVVCMARRKTSFKPDIAKATLKG